MTRKLHLELDVSNRLCLVAGGGNVAAHRVRRLLQAGARVRVVSPCFHPRLLRLNRHPRLELIVGRFRPNNLRECFLAVAATNDARANRLVLTAGRKRGVLVNRADGLAADVSFPAALHQGPLSVAISTGGASPLLARQLKRDLQARWAPRAALWSRTLEQLRPWIKRWEGKSWERRCLWRQLVQPQILDALIALPASSRPKAAKDYLDTGQLPGNPSPASARIPPAVPRRVKS